MSDEPLDSGSESGPDAMFRAEEVRRVLDMYHNGELGALDNDADSFSEVIAEVEKHEAVEKFAKQVVETGKFPPEYEPTADVDLTLRERLTGTHKHDIATNLIIGMLLGGALEQDIPTASYRDAVWVDGGFVLPESRSRGDRRE